MATVGEAIAATLIAQWTAAGGAQPDPIQYLVERPERDPNPTVADAVYVWLPLRRKFDPVDVKGTYRNVTYTIRIVCHTKTSSARQKEIENEVDRILNSGTVITGATKQTVKEINDISNRSYSVLPKYISEVIVEVFTAMEVSATAYGTGTTSTFETDELTVNTWIKGYPKAYLDDIIFDPGQCWFDWDAATDTLTAYRSGNKKWRLSNDFELHDYMKVMSPYGIWFEGAVSQIIKSFKDEDDMSSDAADAVASQQSIKAYIDAVNMIGSANAARVPMALMGANQFSYTRVSAGWFVNLGADNVLVDVMLPIACGKGSLKLWISNLKFGVKDADDDDYVTSVIIRGLNGNADTTLDTDATDHKTTGNKTFSGAVMPAAAIDCSGYQTIIASFSCSNTDAAHLDFGNIRMECYYA